MPRSRIEKGKKLYSEFFAPVAQRFTEWVLDEAKKNGQKRLYFLARDGFIFHEIARSICEYRNLDIEIRYLKVSRCAVRSAQYFLMKERCLDIICVGGIDVSFRRMMRRALLHDDEIEKLACGLGIDIDRVLNYKEILHIKTLLSGDEKLLELIYDRSRINYHTAIGYLAQEGLLDEVPYALVDSGWVGTLQQSIEMLLQHEAGVNSDHKLVDVEGYYFGMYDIPPGLKEDKYHCFYFSPRGDVKKKTLFSNCLFETVFSAPEGMTLGYREGRSLYEPIESKMINPNAEYITAFSDEQKVYTEQFLKKNIKASVECKEALKNLQKLMSNPTKDQMDILGNMLFCDDILEDRVQPVAADLSIEDIKNQRLLNKILIMLKIKKAEIHESAWIEGSIVRNESVTSGALGHVRLYKELLYMRKAIGFGKRKRQ